MHHMCTEAIVIFSLSTAALLLRTPVPLPEYFVTAAVLSEATQGTVCHIDP